MRYFVGIDIGSTAIKISVADENKNLVGHKISASGSMFYKYAQETLDALIGE
jgi:sugar (pentulose or hexulose) kinase